MHKSEHSGFALLMVIVILLALMIIALPMSNTSSNQLGASNSIVARTKAKQLAESASLHAMMMLSDRHEDPESAGRGAFNSPLWDGKDELVLDFGDLNAYLPTMDEKSSILSSVCFDENAKLNLDSIPIWTIGNLIGSCMNTAPIEMDYTGEVEVDSIESLDPAGYLWIHPGYATQTSGQGQDPVGEIVTYRVRSATSIEIMERGVFYGDQNYPGEFSPPRAYDPGTLMIDIRAYKIHRFRTMQQFGMNDAHLARFGTIENIRRIAEYDLIGDQNFGHLEVLSPNVFLRVQPMLTVHSGRLDGHVWTNPKQILGFNVTTGMPTVIMVDDESLYSPGTIVRIRYAGAVEYATIMDIRGGGQLKLDRQVPGALPLTSIVESFSRNPVNVNTADYNVLFAMLYGLSAGRNQQIITRPQATWIAWNILSRTALTVDPNTGDWATNPFQDISDFSAFINGIPQPPEGWPPIGASERRLVIRNATNPLQRTISRGSVPLSFTTSDVYTIESSAIVGNRGGDEVSSWRIKQIVQTGPESASEADVSNLGEFGRALRLGVGANFGIEALDGSVIAQYQGNGSFQFGMPDSTAVRLRSRVVEGPYDSPSDNGDGEPGPVTANASISTPMAVQFWYKPLWTAGANAIYIADSVDQSTMTAPPADAEYVNRMSLLFDPEATNENGSQGALVMRMYDSSLEHAWYEFRYLAGPTGQLLLANNWYHFHLISGSIQRQSDIDPEPYIDPGPPPVAEQNYSGYQRRDHNWQKSAIGFLVNGDSNAFGSQPEIGFARRGPGGNVIPYSLRTNADIDGTPSGGFPSGSLPVANNQDLAMFFTHDGIGSEPQAVVRIGDEAFVLQDRGGNFSPRYVVAQRGARRQSWDWRREGIPTNESSQQTEAIKKLPEGSLITPFGYQETLPQQISAGNGIVASNLGTILMSEMDVTTTETDSKLKGLLSDANKITVLDASDFQDAGWILIVGAAHDPGEQPQPPPGGGTPQSPTTTDWENLLRIDWEIAFHNGRSGNDLTGLDRSSPKFFRDGWTVVIPISIEVEAEAGMTMDYDLATGFIQLMNENQPWDPVTGLAYEWVQADSIDQSHGNMWYFRLNTPQRNNSGPRFVVQGSGPITRILTSVGGLMFAERTLMITMMQMPGGGGGGGNTGSTYDQMDLTKIGDSNSIADASTLYGIVYNFTHRKRAGTPLLDHSPGRNVMPVWRTASQMPGRFDHVTIVNDQFQNPEMHGINHTVSRSERITNNPQVRALNNEYSLCALRAQVGRTSGQGTYPAGSQLLKFPTGNLPSVAQQSGAGSQGGTFTIGGIAGGLGAQGSAGQCLVDSTITNIQNFGVLQSQSAPFATTQGGGFAYSLDEVVERDMLSPSALFATRETPPASGLMLMGDELLVFATNAFGQSVIQRSYRDSSIRTRAHPAGTVMLHFPLQQRGVTTVVSDTGVHPEIASGVGVFPQGQGNQDEPSIGYILVDSDPLSSADDEVIGFTGMTMTANNTVGLTFPVQTGDVARAQVFRGQFGTTSSPKAPGSLAIAWPVRYVGAYAGGVDLPEGVYFSAAFARTGAKWDELYVTINQRDVLATLLRTLGEPALGQAGGRVASSWRSQQAGRVRAVVRLDGAPSFEDQNPVFAPLQLLKGRLFVADVDLRASNSDPSIFKHPNDGPEDTTFKFPLGGIDADTIEIRIYFPMPPGSFQRGSHNVTPYVSRVGVKYRQETQVLQQWARR
ncbi:MAG: hypothetical protein NUW37_12480 [Planctomycetes bacterium]|nr:hypothetical protein [Planctomycetota bacterium]